MRRSALAVVSAVALAMAPAPVLAQETSFTLELNSNKDKDNKCTVTFRANNKLGVDISEARFEVYVISVTGQALDAFNLKMTAIPSGKQRFMQFPLPYPCDQIASLFSSGFSLCQGQKDQTDLCNKGLKMSSKTGITFGDDAT